MSSIAFGFVSSNMKKIKTTLKTSNNAKHKHENETPPSVTAGPVKAIHELYKNASDIMIQINDIDVDNTDVETVQLRDRTVHEKDTVHEQAYTLPRYRPKSESVGAASASVETSAPKVKLRRRISLNPSWKAVSSFHC